MENLKGKPMLWNMPFVPTNVSVSETVPLKTFPWMFPDPHFIKNIIIFDVSNGVYVRFVHRALQVHPTVQVFTAISVPTISTSSVAKLFGECIPLFPCIKIT